MKLGTSIFTFLVAGLALTTSGCLSKTAATATTTTGGGTGAGGTFTASDLGGSGWTSSCVAATSGITTATYVSYSMSYTGSNFNHSEAWYSAAGCGGGALVLQISAGGTFAVGGITTGSLQSIDYTVTSHTMRPYTATVTTFLNAQCSGGGFTNGAITSTYTKTCSFETNPNSGLTAVANVGTLNSSTSLSLGAYEKGVPGVLSGAGYPTSASLSFTR